VAGRGYAWQEAAQPRSVDEVGMVLCSGAPGPLLGAEQATPHKPRCDLVAAARSERSVPGGGRPSQGRGHWEDV
jgi:hypothetical protein